MHAHTHTHTHRGTKNIVVLSEGWQNVQRVDLSVRFVTTWWQNVPGWQKVQAASASYLTCVVPGWQCVPGWQKVPAASASYLTHVVPGWQNMQAMHPIWHILCRGDKECRDDKACHGDKACRGGKACRGHETCRQCILFDTFCARVTKRAGVTKHAGSATYLTHFVLGWQSVPEW